MLRSLRNASLRNACGWEQGVGAGAAAPALGGSRVCRGSTAARFDVAGRGGNQLDMRGRRESARHAGEEAISSTRGGDQLDMPGQAVLFHEWDLFVPAYPSFCQEV